MLMSENMTFLGLIKLGPTSRRSREWPRKFKLMDFSKKFLNARKLPT